MKTQKYSWNTGSYPSFSSPLSFNMPFSWWPNPFTSPQTLLLGQSSIIQQKNQHLWLNDIIRLLAGSSVALVTESLDLGKQWLIFSVTATFNKRQMPGRWKVTFNGKGFFFPPRTMWTFSALLVALERLFTASVWVWNASRWRWLRGGYGWANISDCPHVEWNTEEVVIAEDTRIISALLRWCASLGEVDCGAAQGMIALVPILSQNTLTYTHRFFFLKKVLNLLNSTPLFASSGAEHNGHLLKGWLDRISIINSKVCYTFIASHCTAGTYSMRVDSSCFGG